MLPETFLVPTNSYLAFMSAPKHPGICGDFLFDVLVALFPQFRDQQRGTTKPAKRFLLSNWK